MFSLEELQAEVATDPQKIGYEKQSDATIAKLLNSSAKEIVTLASIAKNDFLKATAGAVMRLGTGVNVDGKPIEPVISGKWQALIDQCRAADPGSQIDLTLLESGTLGSPVDDRIMTVEEFAVMTQRTGTRAEVLWGQGVVISEQQIGEARNGK